jgi:hypothetical protein
LTRGLAGRANVSARPAAVPSLVEPPAPTIELTF